MTFPTLVQSFSPVPGLAGPSLPVNLSLSGLTEGNLLVVLIGQDSDTAENLREDGTSLFNRIAYANGGGIFVREAGASGFLSVDFITNTNEQIMIVPAEYSNWSGNLADVEASLPASLGVDSFSFPTLTPAYGLADYLVQAITLSSSGSRTLISYPSGYTLQQVFERSGTAGGDATVTRACKEENGTSFTPGTQEMSGSYFGVAFTLAIPGAAGGGSSVEGTLTADVAAPTLMATGGDLRVATLSTEVPALILIASASQVRLGSLVVTVPPPSVVATGGDLRVTSLDATVPPPTLTANASQSSPVDASLNASVPAPSLVATGGDLRVASLSATAPAPVLIANASQTQAVNGSLAGTIPLLSAVLLGGDLRVAAFAGVVPAPSVSIFANQGEQIGPTPFVLHQHFQWSNS